MDLEQIDSVEAAIAATRQGVLARVLLLPALLGGEDVPENVVYVPLFARDRMERGTNELIDAIRNGMHEVEVRPSYKGRSFVPSKIEIIASKPGGTDFVFSIDIW